MLVSPHLPELAQVHEDSKGAPKDAWEYVISELEDPPCPGGVEANEAVVAPANREEVCDADPETKAYPPLYKEDSIPFVP
eukprot:CAMPEP_0197551280 /NCGR_PEP_ID=MMETSP1320-20131121/4601_1 /TAXON_ID=91990 /ORGANISM="Bolidomonas sp., Strain RCC2347" /LENGTH=79 /DNA_ID=CAMNT_0043111751 /DNA_START=64 /DNA_END=303 /DNA_ORIENTATION=-